MSATMEHPRRHRITADEYYRMWEQNFFAPDARTELIDGVIIEMAPIGNPHMSVVDRLVEMLVSELRGKAIVRGQGSVRLGDYSVPQPDITLLKPRPDYYRNHTASPADVLLVIEVSDSTLRFDLDTKVPLYGRHGIAEVWVIDVQGRRVHFFRDLQGNQYQHKAITAGSGATPIAALPETALDLSFLRKF